MNDQPERIAPEEEQAARLTAFALGEVSEAEQRQMEAHLDESLRRECEEVERLAVAFLKSDGVASLPEPSAALREAIESKLANDAVTVSREGRLPAKQPRRRLWLVLATGLALLLVVVSVPYVSMYNLIRVNETELAQLTATKEAFQAEATRADDRLAIEQAESRFAPAELEIESRRAKSEELYADVTSDEARSFVSPKSVEDLRAEMRLAQQNHDEKQLKLLVTPRIIVTDEQEPLAATVTREQPGAATDSAKQAQTNNYGRLPPDVTHSYIMPESSKPTSAPGIAKGEGKRAQESPAPIQLAAGPATPDLGSAVVTRGSKKSRRSGAAMYGGGAEMNGGMGAEMYGAGEGMGMSGGMVGGADDAGYGVDSNRGKPIAHADGRGFHLEQLAQSKGRMYGTLPGGVTNEQYAQIVENRFASVGDEPLSTFSIDVDTASYANARRFLSQNQMPPANAIRIEEFINYFSYDYPAPREGEPFSVNMEVAACPWQPAHQLVRIGLKGKEVRLKQRPASNIVFLLDVSGSMQDANKLPLLKQAMKLLTDQLTESDHVSIVTYAGNAGLALDTTNGESKQTIRDAIDALNANGSTNGSAGIQLAYEKATQSFMKEGANRVILATDGDLNVGVTDDDALVELIRQKAASGVFLTVLGFGEGNLKDGKLEKLADNGNGMYAYVDSLREARKVLVEQITGSLVTIAKDVKIKVEFNPAEVAAYRLLGYENRLMSAPDFDNDAKDAGEIGAGHTVTGLYEIVPSKIPQQLAATTSSLKYQRPVTPTEPPKELTAAAKTGELLTLFLRYKQPNANESTLSEFTVENKQRAFDDASTDFRFAAAVASFAMVLRNSEFRGNSSLADIEQIASSAIGSDERGHRTEFLDLVRKASTLPPQR